MKRKKNPKTKIERPEATANLKSELTVDDNLWLKNKTCG